MPVVVGPVAPVAPVPVTSSDGILTATPRYDLGAVLLKVQFGSAAVNARTVTVTRGDGSAVRGLDHHAAPSGVTAGIDAEADLGSVITYRATATARDGTTTWTSTPVALTVARPTSQAWWTCLSRPAMSCLTTVVLGGYPDWGLTGRVGVFTPLSSSYAATAIGVPYYAQAPAQVLTRTVDEATAFEALISLQEPLLLQPDAQQAPGRPDDYVTVLSATRAQPGVTPGERVWSLTLARNERPDTAGSTVVIPGRTIGDLAAAYPTIGALPSPPLRWLTG